MPAAARYTELNKDTATAIWRDVATTVQEAKVRDSIVAIGRQNKLGKFPPPDRVISYVGTKHPSNRYLRLDKFYVQMLRSPSLWNKKFIFAGAEEGAASNKLIAEAAVLAEKLYDSQLVKYPTYKNHFPTGILRGSARTYLNNHLTGNVKHDVKALDFEAYVEITNVAEYASSAEARALYITKIGGILFWVANRIRNRFPELAITFNYSKAQDFNAGHIYELPVLTITDKSLAPTYNKWTRPGVNHRKRVRQGKKLTRRRNILKKYEV